MNQRLMPCLLAAAFLYGCETGGPEPGDPSPAAPSVSSPSLAPDSLRLDSLATLPDGKYEITLTASVRASDPDGPGDIATVRAEAIRPGALAPFSQAQLRDDGSAPDDSAGDGVYAGVLTFRAARDQAGVYRIRFSAQDGAGLRSTGIERSFALLRRNAAPALDPLSLSAPDTVARPTAGTLLFRVSIAASDSDGLADIQRVFIQNLATTTISTLLDDGGTVQPNGITSGDSLAGDGVFSITFGLSSTNPAGTILFRLQAVDASQDTSASVPYTLVVE